MRQQGQRENRPLAAWHCLFDRLSLSPHVRVDEVLGVAPLERREDVLLVDGLEQDEIADGILRVQSHHERGCAGGRSGGYSQGTAKRVTAVRSPTVSGGLSS
jgi:hypothetical protein